MSVSHIRVRGKGSSDVLAVHAVGHATVPGDAVAEVLDVERALEAGREEPAEGRDERCEASEHEYVVLVGCIWDRRELMTGLSLNVSTGELFGYYERTYHRRKQSLRGRRDRPLPPDEYRIGVAVQVVKRAHAEVVHGANHVVEAHEVGRPHDAENDRAKERADEALDGLLGRELDERCAPDGDSPDVREDIVADDERRRHPEPDHTLEDVVDDEVARDDDQHERHVDPAEEPELLLEVSAFERHDETDEADSVERETDHPVVRCEDGELCICEDNMLGRY